jgi:hypothetical protein
MAEIIYLLHSRRKFLSVEERHDCDKLLDLSPLLRECYRFVQRIYAIYDKRPDFEGANKRIRTAWAMLSDVAKSRFSKFGNALANTPEELLNYFEWPLTTACSEANNRSNRDIQSAGRGLQFPESRRRAIFSASPSKLLALAKLGIPGPLGGFTDGDREVWMRYCDKSRHGKHRPGKKPRKKIAKQLELFPDLT